MNILAKLFLIALTLTGPFFIIYGGYIITYGKKNDRIKGIALILGGIFAGGMAYLFNRALFTLIF